MSDVSSAGSAGLSPSPRLAPSSRLAPSPLPVTLRAMTDAELDEFGAHAIEGYIEHRVASGQDPDEARQVAEQQFADYLPGGRPAGADEVLVAEHDGQRVGVLWLGPMSYARDDASRLWIYDIEVDEAFRGRGFGRALLAAAEARAAERGAVEIGLNVFGQNTRARALYRSAGWVERSVQMSKPLI